MLTDDMLWTSSSVLSGMLTNLDRSVDPASHTGIKALIERDDITMSTYARHLAGAAMMPQARDRVTNFLNKLWSANKTLPSLSGREVIIGSGISAATYAAARVRMGFPKPVVLERNGPEQVGGTFAMSMKPVFYLNSRNRSGKAGLPGEGQALNYIPGAVIQPSDISDQEYQTNADLAWLIRATLAEFAEVYPNQTVSAIGSTLVINGGQYTYGRVIDARGLGDENQLITGPNVLTYSQFMRRMGTMFPLRGLERVAVIGSGDAAKTVIESLLGLGPPSASLASLDTVKKIQWYAPGIQTARPEFLATTRPRYGRLVPFIGTSRLGIFADLGTPTPTLDGAIVNGRRYDLAITCTGYSAVSLGYVPEAADKVANIARRTNNVYWIGVGAKIELSGAESNSRVDKFGNEVGIFRFANRTAALAVQLPGV